MNNYNNRKRCTS